MRTLAQDLAGFTPPPRPRGRRVDLGMMAPDEDEVRRSKNHPRRKQGIRLLKEGWSIEAIEKRMKVGRALITDWSMEL